MVVWAGGTRNWGHTVSSGPQGPEPLAYVFKRSFNLTILGHRQEPKGKPLRPQHKAATG
jgi:hypothetical protein